MMKKNILTWVMCFLCGSTFAGEPIGVAVTTTNAGGVRVLGASVCVLPQRGMESEPVAWTSISGKVVYASQVIKNASGVKYYALNSNSCAATNQPTHTSGMKLGADDGILWQVYPETHALRKGLSVTKVATDGVSYVSFGRAAVAGRGIGLASYGASLLIPSGAVQDPVFVISTDTNDAVCAQDW